MLALQGFLTFVFSPPAPKISISNLPLQDSNTICQTARPWLPKTILFAFACAQVVPFDGTSTRALFTYPVDQTGLDVQSIVWGRVAG